MPHSVLIVRAAAVGVLTLGLVGGVLAASGVGPTLAAGALAQETTEPHGQPTSAPGQAAPAATAQPRKPKNALRAYPWQWAATSPATHKGDRYELALTNGPTAQRVLVQVSIMDHSTHQNMPVIQETLDLGPGEQRTLSATNDYGTANHFQTKIGSQSQDLAFTVTVSDAQGVTATYNQRAFWLRQAGERKHAPGAAAQKRQRQQQRHQQRRQNQQPAVQQPAAPTPAPTPTTAQTPAASSA